MTAKRLYYYLLGGTAAGLLVLAIGLLWLWGAVHAASDRSLLSDASAHQIETRMRSLERLSVNYHKLAPTLAKLDQALPQFASQELVVSMLKSQAAAAGTGLLSIEFKAAAVTAPTPVTGATPATPRPATPTPVAPRGISYTVKVTGNYVAVRSLFARLDTATPLSDVTSWSISKPQKEPDSMEVTLEMVSYDQR